MLDGRTPLHVFERGTVTGVRYRDEILEPYVRLFRGAVGPEFILMGDRALLVDEFLKSEDIRRMDWPARSPDLNPIQHVWDALRRAIATRNPPPRTIQEMKTTLLNEWDQLPQEMINCLTSSMKSRCKACKRGPYTLLTFFLFILQPLFHNFRLQRVLRRSCVCIIIVEWLFALYQCMYISNFIKIGPVVPEIIDQVCKFS
ncbi:hypothetical protein AVEN_96083-1 [Araneus ventricosus]|uniref:Tc1-like transposase DDE domain-containing protein n=1 Tax=Araneus ventricosus TaxID=182803 RepID=A0A4Y2B5X5_ARAVE|nr:hypothetical protein AVEN_96083-1 [Araneus ventricosus]